MQLGNCERLIKCMKNEYYFCDNLLVTFHILSLLVMPMPKYFLIKEKLKHKQK